VEAIDHPRLEPDRTALHGAIRPPRVVAELRERRNPRVRRLRDRVAAQYGLHPSALAPVGEETLRIMARNVELGLVRVTVYRVEESMRSGPPDTPGTGSTGKPAG
jgi:hypothetical protein